MNTKDYNEAERMIFRVASVMGYIGNVVISAGDETNNRLLKWDDTKKLLVSKTFALNGGEPIYIAFNPTAFVYTFLNTRNKVIDQIDVEDMTARELLSWNRKWFHDNERTEIHETGLSHDFDTWDVVIKRPHDEFLFLWLALRSQANLMLQSLNGMTGNVSQVIVYTEHFESRIHYTLHTEMGKETHVIEAGLAMASHPDEWPYYFIRGKRKGEFNDLRQAPQMEHVVWHSGEWTDARYRVMDSDKFPSSEAILNFFEQSYEFLSHHVIVG
jgi:hypothetical protein